MFSRTSYIIRITYFFQITFPGSGDDYEIYISACFALNLISNKDIKDFSIQNNVKNFGKFGDVVIDVTLQKGKTIYSEFYAIQLKHRKTTTKTLRPQHFEEKPDKTKGGYYLPTYYKSFETLPEETTSKYHFILYTKKKFNTRYKEKAKKFKIWRAKPCKGDTFFDTSSGENKNVLYKFEAKHDFPEKKKYGEFFKKFNLYTRQGDVDTLKTKILNYFSSEEEKAELYIDLFKKWYQNKFTNKIINRKTVVFHVTNILLSNGLITNLDFPTDNNLKLFKEAVQLFDITLIKASASEFSENLESDEEKKNSQKENLIQVAKEVKLVENDRETLDKYEEEEIWSCFFRKLLIIDEKQVSNQSISKATSFYQNEENAIKFIVLSESDIYLQCPIFRNLEDLRKKCKNLDKDLFNRITDASKVSLQGQDEITLTEFAKSFPEIPSLFGTKEVVEFLKNDCILLGENKGKQSLKICDFDTVVDCITSEEADWDKQLTYRILNDPNNCLVEKHSNSFWIVEADLKTHNQFLTDKNVWIEDDDAFLKLFKKDLRRHKLMIFFLHGLEELDNKSLLSALIRIKKLLEEGFRVWISSQHLESFVIEIIEFNKFQQNSFVRNRLKNKYTDQFIDTILCNTYLNNYEYYWGQVLRLCLITQVFLDKKYEEVEEEMFVLTNMYRFFFESRYQQLTNKNLEELLEHYELVALHFVFDSEVVDNLNLERNKTFLEEDPLNILVTLNKDGKAVFEHESYAEFFVSSYLRKNVKVKLLKDEIFSDRYRNVMLMLSLMLAEESPLLLAVIHRDLPEIEEYQEDKNCYDLGGRNPLQVAVSLAYSNFKNVECWDVSEECNKDKETIKALITKFNPYEKDSLFEIDAFHCAILRKNLFALELILTNYGMTHQAFSILKEKNYIHNEIIACYSIKWSYPNLLAVALEKENSCLVKNEDFVKNVSSYASSATLEIIKMLVKYGVTIEKEKVLRGAVKEDNCEVVECLLSTEDSGLIEIADNCRSWNVVRLFIEKGWKKISVKLRSKMITGQRFEENGSYAWKLSLYEKCHNRKI